MFESFEDSPAGQIVKLAGMLEPVAPGFVVSPDAVGVCGVRGPCCNGLIGTLKSHCQNQEYLGIMTDWMDQIVEAAEQQGFEVRQSAKATWIFRKGLNTIVQPRPATAAEWLSFIAALRQLGLEFPLEMRREIE